jgi:hypothetical protein
VKQTAYETRVGGKFKERQRHDFNNTEAFARPCSTAYLASFFYHDVVTMSVTNPEDIRSYTVASTGQGELLNCSIQVIPE